MKAFADTILHFSELTLPEETVHDESKFVRTSYVPLGVVAAIGPWNCMARFQVILLYKEANTLRSPSPLGSLHEQACSSCARWKLHYSQTIAIHAILDPESSRNCATDIPSRRRAMPRRR